MSEQERQIESSNGSAGVQLTVSVEETNLILEALGNLPFARVYRLIGRLQAQATSQLEPGPDGEQSDAVDERAGVVDVE